MDQISPKGVFLVQNRKNEHYHRIQHIVLVLISSFILSGQFWFFWWNMPKKGYLHIPTWILVQLPCLLTPKKFRHLPLAQLLLSNSPWTNAPSQAMPPMESTITIDPSAFAPQTESFPLENYPRPISTHPLDIYPRKTALKKFFSK